MRRVACIFMSMLLVATVFTMPGINAEVGVITLDDPDPMVYEASQYLVEGNLPIGYSATINGEEAEVFRKFRHTVELNKDPSYTAVSVELVDKIGNTEESGELQVENNHILDAWLQQDNLKWTVDGEELIFHALPQIVDGSMMIPFRSIAEDCFEANVEWITETKTIVMELDNTEVRLTINGFTAYINGEEVKLSAPAIIIDGSTVVPLRFVGEAFGAEVVWHSKDRSVTIQKIIHPDSVESDSFDRIILD